MSTTVESEKPSVITVPTNALVPNSRSRNFEYDREQANSITLQTMEAESSEEDYPTGLAFYMVIVSLALAYILSGFDNTIVATAVPAITDHFHTDADVGWYSAAYRLSLCAFQFIFGKLYKLFSPKYTFILSIACNMIGSLLCATAAGSAMFIVGRAIAGLGAAGITAGCFNIVVRLSPLRRRSAIIAALSAVESASEMTAPIIGGVLTQHLSWQWCFFISLPMGGATLAIVTLALRDPPHRIDVDIPWQQKLWQLDLLGNLIFLPSVTSLFVGLSGAGTKYTWTSPLVVSLLVAFVVLLALFIWQQVRMGDSATLPLRILRQRTVLYSSLFAICNSGSLQVFQYYLPTYYQSVRQYTPSKSGYLMLAPTAGFLIGMLAQGFGTSIVGFYTPFMLICSVLGPAAAGWATTWQCSTPFADLIGSTLFSGFAYGIGYQGPQVAVQTTLSLVDTPVGLAIILFTQHFGAALFVTIGQTIFTNRLEINLRYLTPNLKTAKIKNLGLKQLTTYLGPDRLQEVLAAFNTSLVEMWYLPVALMCISLIGVLGMEWRSVKMKQT
ncbi:HC-toxin efflux carrier TOXA 15 [Phlyctema vagabunda]|uniref:HC-toxin efflux carrier TOXA 15 n=1 Tax=Phlyctema vagabunda TaxID=108571 RepID=A0ABR4P2B7_9HELO